MAEQRPLENLAVKPKTIIVTGGTGFIGSHLVKELLRQKCQIIVPIHPSSISLSYFTDQNLHRSVHLVPVNLTSTRQVLNFFNRFPTDYVIHLAAQSIIGSAYKHPLSAFQINTLGTVHILEAVRRHPNIRGLIIASSDKAYGDKAGRYTETDLLQGDHPYDASKAAADLAAQSYFKTYGLPIVITRFCNIFGPGDLNWSRLVPGIIKSIITKRPLHIRSDGTLTRDYLYINDAVRGYLLILRHFAKVSGEIFNFGGITNLSVKAALHRAEIILGQKIDYHILNQAINEIPAQSLISTKAKRLLKWQPQVSFSQGLRQTFPWYRRFLTSSYE